MNKKLICIVGATASGKTGLGIELAKQFDGEIISADSRQIYRGLDIGTGKEGQLAQSAKITKSEFLISDKNRNSKRSYDHTIIQLRQCLRLIDDIPQWLVDICEPEVEFNMFDWLELAKKVLDDVWLRGKVPIVVGGTGLYVQALVEGFAINQTNEQKNKRTEKQYSREELESLDLNQLQEIVRQLSTANCRLDTNNPRRLIRFIERVQAGEEPVKVKPDFDFILIGCDLPREELYAKIDKRVEGWFDEGFYEEVERLLDGGVSLEWLNKIGLEYKILSNYISHCKELATGQSEMGDCLSTQLCNGKEFVEMKQRMKYSIHQYARRQLTWWRRFDIKWEKDQSQTIKICQEFLCQ